MFYLSNYLEQNRGEYYARLKAISREQDWTGWISFFLTAVIEQAKTNNSRTKLIMNLYESTKEKIRDITRSQHSSQLLDALFDRPIFRVKELATRIGMPKATAHSLLKQLEKEKLIIVIKRGSGRRSSLLGFPELLNIAEGRAVFRNIDIDV
jgi:Fic family protein